jgi:hypothetical protein
MLSDLRGKYGGGSNGGEECECGAEDQHKDDVEIGDEQVAQMVAAATTKRAEEEAKQDAQEAAEKQSAVLTTSMWGSEVQAQREELRDVMSYLKGKYGDTIVAGGDPGSFQC